jgi:predicted dehydrogenase
LSRPRVGVVGVGHLGKQHARIYHQMGALAAVVDADAARAAEIAGPYGVPHFSDFRQLFGKVDAVSVAVPTVGHHEVAKAFLEQGIPALVEKPLTKTIEQGEELCRIAREKNVALQVGHVERFNPAVTAVLDVIKKPRSASGRATSTSCST